MVLVFKARLQPPYVTSVPRRHLCSVRLDHVAPQIHLCAKHNEFLLKASTLFAWMVFLYEMSILRDRLVDRPSSSVEGTDQRLIVLEAEELSIAASHVMGGGPTIYGGSRFVCRRNILRGFLACAHTIRRHQ